MNLSENVVLLHGLAKSSRHMAKLARYLEAQGYTLHNLDYPSRHYAVERLCEYIHEKLLQRIPSDQTVHFVGFSLGALLCRLFLANPRYRPKHLGRVVQLAPPNLGAGLADFLQHRWLYKKYFGPAGQQVLTDQRAIQHLFAPIDYELGVIAGEFPLDILSSFIIGGRNDGVVSVEQTKVKGMKEHVVITGTHAFFPKNKKVMELTAKFLAQGTFG